MVVSVRSEYLLRASFIARRQYLNLSQLELAEKMETTQSHVSYLETGQIDSRFSTWVRWAKALGCRRFCLDLSDSGNVDIEWN